MNQKEFITLIEYIGFEKDDFGYCKYKEFEIFLYYDEYDFYNGSEWFRYVSYNDLTADLLKLFRSIKLKELLK